MSRMLEHGNVHPKRRDFHHVLKAVLERREMTLRAFADSVGISVSTLSTLIVGRKTKNGRTLVSVTLGTARPLAAGMGLELNELADLLLDDALDALPEPKLTPGPGLTGEPRMSYREQLVLALAPSKGEHAVAVADIILDEMRR